MAVENVCLRKRLASFAAPMQVQIFEFSIWTRFQVQNHHRIPVNIEFDYFAAHKHSSDRA